MSDDEVEKFEITDHDLANEFNIHRPRGRQSKHQQIYGVWADESSDEESSGKRASFKSGKKPKNYTAPIGFVAGGVQQIGKKEEKKKESGDEDETMETTVRRMTTASSSDESEEEERPASFQQSFDMTGDIAGMRKNRAPIDTSLIQKGVGSWEKHTKGIGAKLLLQMGYEPGKGLGKSLQGINAPIVAKLRKGRGAIGAYGREEAAKIAEIKTEDVKKERIKEKLSRWRKDDDSRNQRVRYVYKTIDEVISQGDGQSSAAIKSSSLGKVKVIDMTGPEQRVLSGYHAISRQQRPTSEWEARKELKTSNFALPELLHNLNLLVDLCEQDIVSNDRKYKYASDRIVAIDHERNQLQITCEAEEKELSKLAFLTETIDEIVFAHEQGHLSLSKAYDAFKSIKMEHPGDFINYDLAELAASLVSPLMKTALSSWKPLEEPDKPLDMVVRWKNILALEQILHTSTLASPEPWGKLLWHSWIPSIRYASNDWNCRNPEPMLKVLESWKPYLPSWVLQFILESLLMPRLTLYVHEWDPLSDTVPIHSWIHPWLPLLSTHLQTVVFPMIRQALSGALTAWHPSDRSARLMLLPWNGVFTKGEMNAFLVRNILPKLQQTMDEFVINPQHQVLDDHWKWVMEWMDFMPIGSMTTLMVKHFFPKWLQVLSIWLNHCPNYDQVSTWYLGWKSIFPDSLLKQTEVKENFRQALDLMNRSSGSTGGPGAMESVSYLKSLDRESSAPSAAAQSRLQSMSEAVRMGAQGAVTGFKALFAKRCEEKDIVFVPVPNKTHEGKPVYRCGNVLVYFDRNVVFLSTNSGSTWQPQSVSSALLMAEK